MKCQSGAEQGDRTGENTHLPIDFINFISLTNKWMPFIFTGQEMLIRA